MLATPAQQVYAQQQLMRQLLVRRHCPVSETGRL